MRYMLGRVAYADDKHQEALAHYREAIALDGGFRGDPVLLAHVDALLGDPKEGKEGRTSTAPWTCSIDKVGAPAADLLEKVANEGTDLQRRQRAATALDDIGEGKRVDRVSLAILELKKATSCEEKKVMVEKLRDLGDVRALPAIRGLRGRSLGPLRFGASDTALHEERAPRGDQRAREEGRRGARTTPLASRKIARMTRLRYDPENLLTSLVLVFPLFLIYQVGVLFTLPMLNGADFLTVFLFRNLGLTKAAYLGYTPGRRGGVPVAVAVLRRRQRFDPRLILPVFIESAIYALTMGSLIIFVMTRVLHVSPRLAGGAHRRAGLRHPLRHVAGRRRLRGDGVPAGHHDRRRACCSERLLGLGRWVAVTIALLVSSALFSAMHHIPPYGDPLHLGVFTFRVLAGCFFGLIFWFRGFAVAVYTHALYDVYVLSAALSGDARGEAGVLLLAALDGLGGALGSGPRPLRRATRTERAGFACAWRPWRLAGARAATGFFGGGGGLRGLLRLLGLLAASRPSPASRPSRSSGFPLGALAAAELAVAGPTVALGRQRQPGHVLAVVHQHPPRVLEGDLDLAVGHDLGDEPLAELGVGHDDVLVVVLAELVGFRVLLAVLGEELVPGRLLHHRPLLRGDWLRHVVFDVAARLAERVHVPAGIALNAADLVLVLGNDDVRGIALAFGAICLDVRADLVDLVFEHEVHSVGPFRVRLVTQVL